MAICADCYEGGVEVEMVEDNGAGELCPSCDWHDDCGDFPCSGEPGTRTPLCVLRADIPDLADPVAVEAWLS